MFADDRLLRLRALVAELERLPASPKTEWMLAEARARMVDVETGERPRALRPPAEDQPAGDPREPATEGAGASPVKRPPRGRAKATKRPVVMPAQPTRAVPERWASGTRETLTPPGGAAPPAGDSPADPDTDATAFEGDGLLSLEDSPSHEVAPGDGKPEARPWRRGLRG